MSHDGRKTAVVTGGASGLGAVMAQHLAREGYNVAVLDVVDAETGNASVASLSTTSGGGGGRAVFRGCDVSSWQSQADSFKAVYREFGRVDVVCANAGISEGGASAMASIQRDEPEEPNLKILDVNLTGVIYCTCRANFQGCQEAHLWQIMYLSTRDVYVDYVLTHHLLLVSSAVKLAIHYMNKNDPDEASRGNIICTASNAGLYAFPVSPLYAASKAGVIGLVRSTAPILQRFKIRINALAPAVLGVYCDCHHHHATSYYSSDKRLTY